MPGSWERDRMRQWEPLGSIETHQLEIVPRSDCALKVEGTSSTRYGEPAQALVAVESFRPSQPSSTNELPACLTAPRKPMPPTDKGNDASHCPQGLRLPTEH